jgi:PIN domain nuclease of toxin-antitoxin system
MRLLLDTHTFLWWDETPAKLSPTALQTVQDPTNTIFFSAVTVWELQIKIQLGKLQMRMTLKQVVEEQQRDNRLELLPLSLSHIYALDNLQMHHRDPFDRLIIAQAQAASLAIVGNDSQFAAYGVQMIW